MKKFKRVVPFLLALVTALAVVLAGCDSWRRGRAKKDVAVD